MRLTTNNANKISKHIIRNICRIILNKKHNINLPNLIQIVKDLICKKQPIKFCLSKYKCGYEVLQVLYHLNDLVSTQSKSKKKLVFQISDKEYQFIQQFINTQTLQNIQFKCNDLNQQNQCNSLHLPNTFQFNHLKYIQNIHYSYQIDYGSFSNFLSANQNFIVCKNSQCYEIISDNQLKKILKQLILNKQQHIMFVKLTQLPQIKAFPEIIPNLSIKISKYLQDYEIKQLFLQNINDQILTDMIKRTFQNAVITNVQPVNLVVHSLIKLMNPTANLIEDIPSYTTNISQLNNQKDYLLTDTITVSFIDQISKKSITVPCRTIFCNHFQVFDQCFDYNQINKCPVCSHSYLHNDLYTDLYLKAILEYLSQLFPLSHVKNITFDTHSLNIVNYALMDEKEDDTGWFGSSRPKLLQK